MTTIDRPLPAVPDIEAAVLGAILTWPDEAADAVANIARNDAWTVAEHRDLYGVVAKLLAAGKSVSPSLAIAAGADPLSVSAVMGKAGRRGDIADCVRVVVEAAVARAAIRLCYDTAAKLYDSADSSCATVADLSRAAADITRIGAALDVRRLGDDMDGTISDLTAAYAGEDRDGWGIGISVDLDRYLRLRRGEMVIIAARPSVGKTALAIQAAVNLALSEGVTSAIFSLEMSRAMLRRRAVLQHAKINIAQLRQKQVTSAGWEDIDASARLVASLPIWCDDSSAATVEAIRASARALSRRVGLGLVIIDYLQLVRPARSGANREAEVAAISAGCKAMAKELDLPVLVLAQLNRQAEDKPRVSHLRESGAIEQDADVIVLLEPGERTEAAVTVSAHVAKHRNGQTGTAQLVFMPATTRFEPAAKLTDADVAWAAGRREDAI